MSEGGRRWRNKTGKRQLDKLVSDKILTSCMCVMVVNREGI